MFGFIRPMKPELRVREAERFQHIYCGLCHAIQKRYGRLHTMFLSYDMTFLALVLDSLAQDEQQTIKKRCTASLVRAKKACLGGGGMMRAADLSILLTYHKLCDTVTDERGPKAVAAHFLRMCTSRGYRRACEMLPAESFAMQACLAELQSLENERIASLDRPADAFARLMTVMVPAAADEATSRILRQMFYHIGRWVYLIDACTDLSDDLKSGAYNPVALRFGLTTPCLSAVRTEIEITLQRSLADIYNAFQLLSVVRDRELIENIICLGMQAVTQQVLDGKYHSNGGHNRHGSL